MTAAAERERIRGLLAGPAYARVFREVRRRVEEAGFEENEVEAAEDGAADRAAREGGVIRMRARSVTLSDLGREEADALAGLLGVPYVARERYRLELRRLDAALRASQCGVGLAEVLVALGGPLVDRRRARADHRDRLDRLWAEARRHPTVGSRPALKAWLEELERLGLLIRAARRADVSPEALLGQALGVVSELPFPEDVLLPVLAGRLTGDTHGLDAGRPLTTLVLRAVAHLTGRADGPESSLDRRDLWAEVGVLCDALSSQVLLLGLRPAGDGRLARGLREAAEAGEPVRVTLRELSAAELAWPRPVEVFVCENPAVTAAAADALGRACAPLVCTEGVPSLAARRLLAGLGRSGAVIRVQADFDWPGLRIARVLADGEGVRRPWRLTASEYEARIAQGAVPLRGQPVAAPWDSGLEPAMVSAGVAVYEEQLLDGLVADLEGAAG